MSSPWSDLALDAPTVYYDPDAKVAIAPVWTDGGSAGVSVTGGGQPDSLLLRQSNNYSSMSCEANRPVHEQVAAHGRLLPAA